MWGCEQALDEALELAEQRGSVVLDALSSVTF